MRKIERAIITGPTGAIGVALCERLAREGVLVCAVTRPGSERARRLSALGGVSIVECDAANLDELPDRLSGQHFDAFFHLAWSGTVGRGRNDMPVQIANVRHAIDACRAAQELGCSVFVGAGSQAEYGRCDRALAPETPCFPESGYGMAKLCAGQMSRLECAALGLDHVWARILSVYGPCDGEGSMVMRTIASLLAGERPALTAAVQLWDFLYADDAAEALYLMGLRGKNGAVYPLGSGDARPLREYVEELRDAIDSALPLGFGEVSYGPNQIMHLEADLTALRADTGFSPRVEFKAGIKKTIDWVRAQHG